MPLRKTEDFQAVKTRTLVVQNPDGTYPAVGAVAVVADDRGLVGFTQDICAASVSLFGGGGDVTLTTDGTQLLVEGVPVGGGGGGGVTSVAAGAGIGVDVSTGAVTITNRGVRTITQGSGITVSDISGDITISATGGGVNIVGNNGVQVTQQSGTYYIKAIRSVAFNGGTPIYVDVSDGSKPILLLDTGATFELELSGSYIVDINITGNISDVSSASFPNALFFTAVFVDSSGNYSILPPLISGTPYDSKLDIPGYGGSSACWGVPLIKVTESPDRTFFFNGSFASQMTNNNIGFTNIKLFMRPSPFNRDLQFTIQSYGGVIRYHSAF